MAPDIEAFGATLIVISPQRIKYSKQIVKKFGFTNHLFSDQGNTVASQFGIVFRLPDYLHDLYRKFGADLQDYNGDNSWTLPMPGRFITNKQGIIRNVDIDPDYTIRPEPKEIMILLKECC